MIAGNMAVAEHNYSHKQSFNKLLAGCAQSTWQDKKPVGLA